MLIHDLGFSREPSRLGNRLIASLWHKVGAKLAVLRACIRFNPGRSSTTKRFAMFPVLRLRRRRLQPPREHYRLGARPIPFPLLRLQHYQVGPLPLRIRRASASRYRERYAANLKPRASSYPLYAMEAQMSKMQRSPGEAVRDSHTEGPMQLADSTALLRQIHRSFGFV